MIYRNVFLFIAFATGCITAHAQTAVSLDDGGKIAVNGQLKYLHDPSQTLTIEDARKLVFADYPSRYSPNIRFDRSAHWFKVDLVNNSKHTEWLLEVAYSPLDQVDVYFQDTNGSLIHKRSGDHFPIATDLPHRHPIFAFHIPPSQRQEVYIRVFTISSVQVPITFSHREAFLKTSYKIQLLNGLFYGAMVLMILYQLFLLLFGFPSNYVYYVLTLLTMVNVVSFFPGLLLLFVSFLATQNSMTC